MSTATETRSAGSTAAPGPDDLPAGHRWRRLRIGVSIAVVLALLATGGWLVLFSSVLGAKRVRVSGVHDLTTDQVQAAAQVSMGRPLARQDLRKVAQRVAQLPQVDQARVSRDWPDTVAITVVERRPVLAVAQPGGFVLVDQHGVAYVSRTSIPPGVQQVDVNPENAQLLREVATVAQALPPALASKVSRIASTSSDDITVRLSSGVVVTWGSSADSTLKAQVTQALLAQKPHATVDVSSPHNPAYR